MKLKPAKQRPGVTLIEVLSAIFIMGIGLLTLLVLFPIGIITMAQALQDDRTGHATDNARAVGAAREIRQDPFLTGNMPTQKQDFFSNPNPGGATENALPHGASWPIYVDPIGVRSFGPPFDQWVGGQANGIPRRSVSFVFQPKVGETPKQAAWKWFTSLDDILFDFEGTPDQISPQVFRRESLYSWAYLLRRRMNGKPGIVDMEVVVYRKRPTAMNNNTQAGEAVYTAQFDPLNNIITVTWNPIVQIPPNVGIGDWVLDSTLVPSATKGKFQPAHGRFYRIVGISQPAGAPNTAKIEVATSIHDFPLPPPAAGPARFQGTIVVLDGVVDVFEMGAGKHP